MFKKSSDNAQARADHRGSRSNDAGIDAGVFAAHPKANRSISLDDLERERIVLGNDKQENEELIAMCTVKIETAERSFRRDRETALSRQLYQALLRERDDLRVRRMNISQKQRENKLAISDQRRAENLNQPRKKQQVETFAEVFHQIAKEMLATPILNRLTTATIHRMGEHIEEAKRRPEGQ